MSEQESASRQATTAEPPARSAKRPEEISERLKDWIVEHDLKPGDRLPQERELIEMFKASKSTVREALGALQTQGLVRTRTGPGGGAYIAQLDGRRAMELLGNYFFFSQPTIGDIYALRKLLEPEMAASLVGKLDEADYRRLHATIRLYDHPPANLGEEYRQRLAELDFHSVLAALCPNPVLGFFCGFLQNLLRNLTICRRIYSTPNPELRESGFNYQVGLLAALHRGDEAEVRRIMYEHMCAAQAYMESCEAEMTNRFLRLDRS
ncbi:MAG: FadR/GntR family transcriptional regulator [Kiloniellales bacterium]